MLSIILIILILAMFYHSKYSSKNTRMENKKCYEEIVDDKRKNWKLIKIKTSDCLIINYDTLINENNIEEENENFFEWLDKNPHSEKKVVQKRSKLICNLMQNNKIEKQFVKIIDTDYTVLEFKIRLKDFINVYIPKHFDSEDYFIDLEFLENPIDIIMSEVKN